MTFRRSRRRPSGGCRVGFTLVELLVVIGIIAVLVGILMPALRKARDQAVRLQCLSNLRSISQLMQIYANQFSSAVPSGRHGTLAQNTAILGVSPGEPHNTPGATLGFGLLVQAGIVPADPYSDVPLVFFCPSNDTIQINTPPSSGHALWFGTTTRMGYSHNPRWGWETPCPGPAAAGRKYGAAVRQWNYETEKDENYPDLAVKAKDSRGQIPRLKDWKGMALAADTMHQDKHLKQTHKGGANVLYADWSAQWVPIDLWRDEWRAVEAVPQDAGYKGAADKPIHKIWKKWGNLNG